VGENHAEFCLCKDPESSLSTLPCYGCELVVFDKAVHLIDMSQNDPRESIYD